MTADNTRWKVTALLFSGRQNPEWQLTEAQQQHWMRLWEEASVSNAAVESSSKLGYTGCTLQFNEHNHWHLYNGYVSFYDAEKIISKKDDEKQMELFLLNTAPQQVIETLTLLKVL